MAGQAGESEPERHACDERHADGAEQHRQKIRIIEPERGATAQRRETGIESQRREDNGEHGKNRGQTGRQRQIAPRHLNEDRHNRGEGCGGQQEHPGRIFRRKSEATRQTISQEGNRDEIERQYDGPTAASNRRHDGCDFEPQTDRQQQPSQGSHGQAADQKLRLYRKSLGHGR